MKVAEVSIFELLEFFARREKQARLENLALPETMDYRSIAAFSIAARDKLSRQKPRTIGQASRISGINPADISVLLVFLGR